MAKQHTHTQRESYIEKRGRQISCNKFEAIIYTISWDFFSLCLSLFSILFHPKSNFCFSLFLSIENATEKIYKYICLVRLYLCFCCRTKYTRFVVKNLPQFCHWRRQSYGSIGSHRVKCFCARVCCRDGKGISVCSSTAARIRS